MDNKLTIKLDNQVIEKAKLYARKKNTSLSKLIESYLELLTTANNSESEEVSPLVKSLSGVLDSKAIPDYKNHLNKSIQNSMTKIFVDTDICLDLLSGRQPFNSVAEKLFTLADMGKIKICVSDLSITI
jgi:hypothetical protein